MNKVKSHFSTESSSEVLSVNRLVELYNDTIEELRLCATLKPNPETDEEVAELREVALLVYEADLLGQAARIQIRNKEDMRGLMDVWTKVSSIHIGDEPSPSDRIAMNIFRHMSDDKFATD